VPSHEVHLPIPIPTPHASRDDRFAITTIQLHYQFLCAVRARTPPIYPSAVRARTAKGGWENARTTHAARCGARATAVSELASGCSGHKQTNRQPLLAGHDLVPLPAPSLLGTGPTSDEELPCCDVISAATSLPIRPPSVPTRSSSRATRSAAAGNAGVIRRPCAANATWLRVSRWSPAIGGAVISDRRRSLHCPRWILSLS
jgi:hypothetical protein